MASQEVAPDAVGGGMAEGNSRGDVDVWRWRDFDGVDLAVWQGSFGPGAAAPSAKAIPEPAAGALAAIGSRYWRRLRESGRGDGLSVGGPDPRSSSG